MSISPSVGIRPYAAEDRALLGALLGDPEMTCFLGGPESTEALDARHERYLHADPGTNGLFTIVIGPHDTAAGWVGYWESEWEGQCDWECGWHVLPAFQGAGVASEATRLALDHARQRQRHRWVHAFPHVDNVASNALCRRLGFKEAGEVEVEYPKGHTMRSCHWRFDLELGASEGQDGEHESGREAPHE